MRLGLGPKAFLQLDGCTLLEHAVATMLAVAARVLIGVPPADVARARHLVGGERVEVVAGGERRADTLRLLMHKTRARWIILHEIVRPLVTPALAWRVIEAARQEGAAAPALLNTDFLHNADGSVRARPHEVVAIQKPIVFERAAVLRAFATEDRVGRLHDPSILQLLELAEQRTHFVPGEAMNVKLTTLDDYLLLQAIVAGRRSMP